MVFCQRGLGLKAKEGTRSVQQVRSQAEHGNDKISPNSGVLADIDSKQKTPRKSLARGRASNDAPELGWTNHPSRT